MSIITDAIKSNWNDVTSYQQELMKAQSVFDSVVGRAGAVAAGVLTGDVVGINEAEIPSMQNAIREYVNNLQTHLDQVKTDTDTSGAFKGEYAVAVKQFVEAICDACGCIISNLLQFNQKLEAVHRAYIAKDRQMSSDISGQAGELSSNFKKYTE